MSVSSIRLLDISEVSGPGDLVLTADEQALFAELLTAWTDDGVLQRADWQKASAHLRHRIATNFHEFGRSSPGDIEEQVLGSETSSASERAIPSPRIKFKPRGHIPNSVKLNHAPIFVIDFRQCKCA